MGDKLTPIELELIAAHIERGASKAWAVREILALRKRREGSRDHGTPSGRAPLTRPVRQLGQILEDGGR